jgi:hypothetical protein
MAALCPVLYSALRSLVHAFSISVDVSGVRRNNSALSTTKSVSPHQADPLYRKMESYRFDVVPAYKNNVTVSKDDFNSHPNDFFDVSNFHYREYRRARVLIN